MSAFVVSLRCMHQAVKALDGDKNSPCEQLDELGRRLYALNVTAVYQRYEGRHGTTPTDSLAETYRYSPCFPGNIQLHKSLSCLIYQCSEGNIPETSALYAEMVEMQTRLAARIVSNLKEWEEAPWG